MSLRGTALLVALAFGLTFAVQALVGGDSPAATPAPKSSAAEFVADATGAAPDLQLAAAGNVPALHNPKRPRKHRAQTRKPKRSVRKVVRVTPTITRSPVLPAATPRPTPTVAPRYIPPAPRSTPRPTVVKPKPTATPAPPPSGEFDTSGEP